MHKRMHERDTYERNDFYAPGGTQIDGTYEQEQLQLEEALAERGINTAFPLLIYSVLTMLFHTQEFIALLATCLPSLLDSMRSVIQHRRLDPLPLIVLLSIVLGLVLIALGIDSRIFLARDVFFTLPIGILSLASIPFFKPLGFYALQRVLDGGSPERTKQLYVRWHYPSYRTSIRVCTAIAGVGIIMEGVTRLSLTLLLSPLQFLSISPFIGLIVAGLVVVSILSYTRLWFRHHGTRLQQYEQENAFLSSPIPW